MKRWKKALAAMLGVVAFLLAVWLFMQLVYCPKGLVNKPVLGGPAREREAIEICKKHLRIIYKAIMQYKEEWGDFPFNLDQISKYLPSKDVLFCPNVSTKEYKKTHVSSYAWIVFWRGTGQISPRSEVERKILEQEKKIEVRSFKDVIKIRGEKAPLVICPHHTGRRRNPLEPKTFVVLRLNGQIEVVKNALS